MITFNLNYMYMSAIVFSVMYPIFRDSKLKILLFFYIGGSSCSIITAMGYSGENRVFIINTFLIIGLISYYVRDQKLK